MGIYIQAIIARTVRTLAVEEMNKEYVRTARSKGLKEFLIVLNHVTKNTMLPTITITGLIFGSLMTGAIFTEFIFSWPGIGSAIVNGILERDFEFVMGSVLIISIIFVIINTITDILYLVFEPRLRSGD